MAAYMLAIACIVALVLPAASGARVMDATRTTISVHQDADTTVPSNATTLGHPVRTNSKLVLATCAHASQCRTSEWLLHSSAICVAQPSCADTRLPTHRMPALQAASPCNGTEETGWQRARYVLNFHMRATVRLLKRAPAAFMWLARAALWLLVGCLFYSVGLSLVMFTVVTFVDFLMIVHLCYKHGGWNSDASATYKKHSFWGSDDRSKKVRSCSVSATRCTVTPSPRVRTSRAGGIHASCGQPTALTEPLYCIWQAEDKAKEEAGEAQAAAKA